MTTVAAVTEWMGRFAPLELAESWDNVGLLLGDQGDQVQRILTCLTVTADSVEEAMDEDANLIVSHHPILFRPAQKILADRPDSTLVWKLARAGIAVYSPHTAFDNCEDGINALLARRFGLVNVRPLRQGRATTDSKVVVFAPASDRDAVLDAAFAAGAGRIGDYSECSFTSGGRGTFFGQEGANPTVGQAGRRETVREWRIEIVAPESSLNRILGAIRQAHSYEEPAIDVYPTRPADRGPGVGRVGRLSEPVPLDAFVSTVRRDLDCPTLQVCGDPRRPVQSVAIGCGAGDDLLGDAVSSGADVFLTGEARFHKALEAEARGVALILAGHYATERPGVEHLAERLGAAFPGVSCWASRHEHDPLR